KAFELDPGYAVAINDIGAAYMNLELTDSAFKYYKRAVQVDSTYESAALDLGLLYQSLGKYDSAIIYIKEAIRLDPSKPKNLFRLACSYALNNQPALAVAALKQSYEN